MDDLKAAFGRGVEGIRKDRFIYYLILLYVVTTWTVAHWFGLSERFSVLVYPETALFLLLVFSFCYACVYSIWVCIVVRPYYPVRYLLGKISEWLCSGAWLRILPLIVCLCIYFSAMSSFKSLIPAMMDFYWDDRLMRLDKFIHGGHEPWWLMHGILSVPLVSYLINFIYNLWFFVMFFVLYGMLLSKRETVRWRFIVSFLLAWSINGSFFALLFSSAGPAFWPHLDNVSGYNPYLALMEYLGKANLEYPIWALNVQQTLWDSYTRLELGVGSGISAMPSMHVSVAVLIFLLSLSYHFTYRILSGLFLLFILVGSVHLGWHYAVDGYFSIMTTVFIWWVVGKSRLHTGAVARLQSARP